MQCSFFIYAFILRALSRRFTTFAAGKEEEKQQAELKRHLEVEEEKQLAFKAFVETDLKKTF